MQAVSRYRGTPVLTLKGREVRVLMTANVILRPALYGQWQGGRTIRKGALEMSRGLIGCELRLGPVFVTVQ